MRIVRAKARDAGAAAPLFNAYRRFYKEASDLPGARRFLRRRLSRKQSVVFLALEEGLPQGFVQLYASYSSTAMKPLWILNDLYVAPAGRRRGLAKALMKKAVSFVRKTGAEGLTLQTAVTNKPAQALYESLGWKRERKFYSYNFDLP